MRDCKKRPLEESYSSDDDDSENGENSPHIKFSNAIKKKKYKKVSSKVSSRNRARLQESEEEEDSTVESDDDDELQAPFCCAKCTHDIHEVETLLVGDCNQRSVKYWISPDGTGQKLCHRKCCHGLLCMDEKELKTWAPPFLASVEESLNNDHDEESGSELEWITSKELDKQYRSSKKIESTLYNNDNLPHAVDLQYTHPHFVDTIQKPFDLVKKRILDGITEPKKATVLDCFAGVGTGCIVLKKLKIAIQKYIYVDHDKIAKHVFCSNHNCRYTESLPDDGIQYKYYGKIERLFYDSDNTVSKEKIKKFVEEQGPIDIILGGPPCSDFSKVNAYRQGLQGTQGHYLLDFARIISTIQSLQQEHRLYFMVENVNFGDSEDLDKIEKTLGLWGTLTLDAEHFSPIRRDRYFWTNVPLQNFEYKTQCIGPQSCLEAGYHLPGHIVDKRMTIKANCLMGSKSRIDNNDSLRMYVFKIGSRRQDKYLGRPLLMIEREKLMGYPVGYIQNPVHSLFNVLRDDGLNKLEKECASEYNGHWRNTLPKIYHTFAGNYHMFNDTVTDYHRFDGTKYPPNLEMAPPVDSDNPVFYNANGYAKHLIGNAYSLPVVEHILRPLCDIFEQQSYPNFEYEYEWIKKEQPYETKRTDNNILFDRQIKLEERQNA